MSVNSKMQAIADKIRAIRGTSGKLGLDAMASDLSTVQTDINSAYTSVSNKGGTVPSSKVSGNLASAISSIPAGATVQTKTGTFTTNSSGKATVDCGWKPDLVAFNIGMANRYSSFSGMPFAAANATDLEMILYPANTQTHLFVIVFGNVTSSGFSIESHKVAYSGQATADSNRSFNYTAIKYT